MAMAMASAMATVDARDLPALLQRFPARSVAVGGSGDESGDRVRMQFRQSGNTAIAPTHVLLHGIGSGSASWVEQLQAADGSPTCHVLAWDAPGYGDSSALPGDAPTAGEYATRMWQWLGAMGLAPDATPITLVGHSLGCLIAASAARAAPGRIRQLVLLAPAQGYARASAAERQKKLQDRLDALATLGPLGIAQKRGSAMLSPHASAAQIAFVQGVMAQVKPHGYTQAARLLAGGDLLADLADLANKAQPACPVQVASGSADGITPLAGCQRVAESVNAPFALLGDVGHVCALEAPEAVSKLIGLLKEPAP